MKYAVLAALLISFPLHAQTIDDEAAGALSLSGALDTPYIHDGDRVGLRIGYAHTDIGDDGTLIEGDGGAVGIAAGVRLNDIVTLDGGAALDTVRQKSRLYRVGVGFSF